ncbi:hypothetical protein E0707_01080 [Lactobacillus helveticus]|nr:hypothetical protein [Lactobacillus helveticus]MBW8062611.1 hypothetical protein [Lactobacillus helveticus]
MIPFSTFVPSFLFKIISNICLRKKGGTSKKTKKGRIHHGIEIPCFLRQLINKNTYTLTAKTIDKALMKKAAEPIFDTTPQSTGQAKVFKQIQKLGKYKSMTVKAVVKNNKVATFNVFVNMKLGKMMTVKVGQSYGNFGSHDFLKVPTNATNAKNLPTTDNNKKKK